MAERAILPDFPNCRACSYFRASVPGTGLLFFFILFFPSLFLNFFSSFFYISSFIPNTVSPLERVVFCAIFPFLFLLPIICRPPLSPSVSHFSKWWVLAYDRLSQVCFNYCKRDGDSTGEEEGERTFVHTLYLRS